MTIKEKNLITDIPKYNSNYIDTKGKKFSLKRDKNIEFAINNSLDNFYDTINYYIELKDCKWVVSFKVDRTQVKEMIESMFEIRLFNDDNKNRYVLNITKEAYEYHQWNEIAQKLEKEIKKYYL